MGVGHNPEALRIARAGSVDDLEPVFLDDGIGQDFFGDALELLLGFFVVPAIKIQDEEFSLADTFHGGVTEAGESVMDGLALGIENRALGHHPDVCFHSVSIALPRAASCHAVSGGRLKGVLETHLGDLFEFALLEAHTGCVGVFGVQRGPEQGRVVGR